MVNQLLFKKNKHGYLVRVIKVRGVWRCHIFAPNGHFSSVRFAAPGAAVSYARFFLASVNPSINKNNQQQLF